jgi:uncharacterized DUF497 family protein
MEIEFDPAKNLQNIALRGLSFELVTAFDFDSAMIRIDARHSAEVRYQAVGMIGSDVVFLVFTMRGKVVRVISLRLANRKERAAYEES